MSLLSGKQHIGQLQKGKGGYFYLVVRAAEVAHFPRGKQTRLICTLDETLDIHCGLNHMGDGNFFLIVASKYMKKLGKEVGAQVSYVIREDPNPLGVEVPEVLEALIAQDPTIKEAWDQSTDGRKRTLIYTIQRVKDFDKQVKAIIDFVEEEERKRRKKQAKR